MGGINYADVANQTLILVMLAVSLNLLFGTGGQVSVAQAAFAAIGAYTAGYLSLAQGIPILLALLIGVAAAAICGALISLPALRLSGEYVMLLTLAVQTIIISLATALPQFGGVDGLEDLPQLKVFGADFSNPPTALPVLAVVTLLVFWACWRTTRSPYGLVLRAIRDDDFVTKSLGRFVLGYKVQMFAFTAGIAGLAGGLLAYYDQVVSPSQYGFDQSVELFAMVVIGGLGNPFGAVIGAVLISLSGPVLQQVVNVSVAQASLLQLLIYGVALVLVVLFLPRGILPERGRQRRQVPVRAADAAATDPGLEQANGARKQRTARLPGGVVPVPDRVSVTATDLVRSYGGVRAVDRASVELVPMAVTALVGPNGAGKTTLFNMLSGAVRSESGVIELNGVDVTNKSASQMVRIGLVRSFQDVRIFPQMSVVENVMLGVQDQLGESFIALWLRPQRVRQARSAARKEAVEWLGFVGLAEVADSTAGELGFGEQKLLALARLLATRAPVLLLDEPGSGVDTAWLERIVDIVRDISMQGRTVCLVEHNLDVVRRLADRVYFMDLGRIVATGTVDDLMRNHAVVQAYFGVA
jgi:branched-chain amino acid transport system permease protein